MSSSFYAQLGISAIKKNRKIYMPYIVMCIFCISMFFMINSLIYNPDIHNNENLIFMLKIAMWVARIFSVIFLFYLNSFLIKQRKKEIGLYNILGMEKRHIAKMMFYECIFCSLISIVLGIIIGIIFNKLSFLFLIKLIGYKNLPKFNLSIHTLLETLIFFGIIFIVNLLFNIIKVRLTKTIELLHSSQIGEKEPKTKIVMTIIGVICIGAGYYYALTAKTPFAAFNIFLIAVILVIIGTYALFTAGSITLLKILKKNKHFYYKTKHFTSISGMLYRMKQNAVGLANICVLSTMVLVSLSTTVSLYVSIQNSLNIHCPKDINVTCSLKDINNIADIDKAVKNTCGNLDISNYSSSHYVNMFCKYENQKYSIIDINGDDANNIIRGAEFYSLVILDYADLEKYCDKYTLDDSDDILIYTNDKNNDNSFNLKINNDDFSYNIKNRITKGDVDNLCPVDEFEAITECIIIVVKDTDSFQLLIDRLNTNQYYVNYSIDFDTNLSKNDEDELEKKLQQIEIPDVNINASSRYNETIVFKQIYGCFLFIGVYIGMLFLCATTIIIYYKQISEGYDDKERFIIMQKVGMNHAEVKKSIHSQIITVFFLPLIVAGIHVIVSFRLIKMILKMLSFGNTQSFLMCTLLTYIVFSIIYAIVYAITAKAYYKIVMMKEL